MKQSDDKKTPITKGPIENFVMSVFDECIETNANARAEAGLKEVIIRKSTGNCCEWCQRLVGEYEYGTEPREVYARHDHCDCTVTFKDAEGYTDVWANKKKETEKENRIELNEEYTTSRNNALEQQRIQREKNEKATNLLKAFQKNDRIMLSELTDDDMEAIAQYVSSESFILNEILRTGTDPGIWEHNIKALDEALLKVPTYQGNLIRTLVFYTERERQIFVNEFVINEEITFNQFISASKKEGYNDDANVIIKIFNSSKGHDIEKFNQDEHEVLYGRNSTFICRNKYIENDIWVIFLDEKK